MLTYSFKTSGFASASLFLILLPSITFLTANSTILPFLVLGMSLTLIILAGTCLGEALVRICFFIFNIKSLFKLEPLLIITNNKIRISFSQDCPIAMDSFISLNFSTSL